MHVDVIDFQDTHVQVNQRNGFHMQISEWNVPEFFWNKFGQWKIRAMRQPVDDRFFLHAHLLLYLAFDLNCLLLFLTPFFFVSPLCAAKALASPLAR